MSTWCESAGISRCTAAALLNPEELYLLIATLSRNGIVSISNNSSFEITIAQAVPIYV